MQKLDYSKNINQLTHKIIGCAMEVHKRMGNGFQEVIYQRALAIEFAYQAVEFEREKEMPLTYRGQGIGTRRVDFFVEELVMVEIKAVVKLEGVHKAQAINYCEAYNIADGLLINFGGQSLEFKRVYNKKFVKKKQIMDENSPLEPFSNFVIFQSSTGKVNIDVFFRNETLWLTQKKMATLFEVNVPAISKHLKNIFKEKELDENSVISILETTAQDGKNYKTKYYNLKAITAVGYRVSSPRAIEFCC